MKSLFVMSKKLPPNKMKVFQSIEKSTIDQFIETIWWSNRNVYNFLNKNKEKSTIQPSTPISQTSHRSIPFIDPDPTFRQRLNNQLLIILQRHFPIPIEISHLHPALYVLLGWVILHSHHGVGFSKEVRDLSLGQVPAFVLVEFVEKSLGDLKALLDFLGVVAGVVLYQELYSQVLEVLQGDLAVLIEVQHAVAYDDVLVHWPEFLVLYFVSVGHHALHRCWLQVAYER